MSRGARASATVGLPALLGLLTFTAFGCGSPGPAPQVGGVIIEGVKAGGAASRAGLEAGDRIVDWRRAGDPARGLEPAAGDLASPLDLARVERAASLAEVSLGVLRGGRRRDMTLPPARWRLDVRPDLPAADLAEIDEARRQVAAGDLDRGLERWRALAERSISEARDRDALWLLAELTGVLEGAGTGEKAADVHGLALGLTTDNPEIGRWLWERRGDSSSPEQAEEA